MQKANINNEDLLLTAKVAARASEFGRLAGVLGTWACQVNGKQGQIVVATTDALVLGMDDATYPVAWGAITIISPEGIATSDFSVKLNFQTTSNTEVLSWMAEYLCPEARAVSLGPGEGHVPYSVRSAEWRRARNRRMTDALRGMGGKWTNALEGSRFNLFSLVGTNDWEDYANAAMSAMTLESMTDLEERVEKLEGLLVEIRDLLARSQDAP